MKRTHRRSVRRVVWIVAASIGCLGMVVVDHQSALAEDAWTILGVTTLPDDESGRLIRAGRTLIDESYDRIGPEIDEPASHYANTNMACSNCHLYAGTRKFALPLVAVQDPIEDKVNICMTTSMNGRALASGSSEMRAIVSYIKFLGASVPAQAAPQGKGQRTSVVTGKAGDGEKIFADICASCHGRTGLGKRNGKIGDRKGYLVPPLWGGDSFNDQAPFMKVEILANFVRDNMPEGTTYDQPTLSPEEAANIAAFVLTAPRPHKN